MISILSEGIYQSPRYELPGIGSFLFQGAFVGALVAFSFPVYGILAHPENGYNFLLIAWLPFILASGVGFGVLVAVLIWAITYAAGHRLHLVVRVIIGAVTLAILLVIDDLLFSDPAYGKAPSARDYFYLIRFYIPHGVVFGLVIGSRLQPLHELLRGTTPPRRLALTGITGFLLRVLIIIGTMYSILIFIWSMQWSRPRVELTMSGIALAHFLAALVIVFARMPFWLLLLLAVVINFPVVTLITDVLTENHPLQRNFVLVYLHLWAAFLVCRLSLPHKEKCNENRNNWRRWFRRQSFDNPTR